MIAAPPRTGLGQVQSDSTYTVQAGDTLYSLARRFDVSAQALRAWNDLRGGTLREGQTLRIRPPSGEPTPADTTAGPNPPTPPPARADTDTVETPPQPYGRHRTQPGDTFISLALRLGTTADTLFALNDGPTHSLEVGRTLRLPRRFGPPTHVVQGEETLYTIAGEYGVSVRALRTANDLDTTAVAPGQRLRLPTQSEPTVPPSDELAPPDSTGRAAVYPEAFSGRLMANGEPYNPETFVASHPSLPYGSVVLLSTPDASRHSFARIADRGPLDEGVLLDVSAAVANELGLDRDGSSTVALRTVWIQNGSN